MYVCIYENIWIYMLIVFAVNFCKILIIEKHAVSLYFLTNSVLRIVVFLESFNANSR